MYRISRELLSIANQVDHFYLDEKLKNIRSKSGAINYIYRQVNPYIRGFFRDAAWENVNKVFNTIRNLGVDLTVDTDKLKGGDYHEVKHSGDYVSRYKQWNLEITFTNKFGKEFKITGRLIATDANDGSSANYFDRYDMSLILD